MGLSVLQSLKLLSTSTSWSSISLSSSSTNHLIISSDNKTGDDKDKTIVGSSLRMAHDNNNGPSFPLPAPTEQALYSYLAGTPYGKLCGTSSPDIAQDLLD